MSELDGREASLKVRKYFEEAHGPLGVLMFEVVEASFREDKWHIRCKFYPSLIATDKVCYEVVVDAKNGRILGAKQLKKVMRNE